LPMRVLKHTSRSVASVCLQIVSIRPVCFNTLGFFTHYKKCFSSPRTPSFAILKCCRLALPCTKRKTPGFLVPGSFCIL
jgi:hypothetical protein